MKVQCPTLWEKFHKIRLLSVNSLVSPLAEKLSGIDEEVHFQFYIIVSLTTYNYVPLVPPWACPLFHRPRDFADVNKQFLWPRGNLKHILKKIADQFRITWMETLCWQATSPLHQPIPPARESRLIRSHTTSPHSGLANTSKRLLLSTTTLCLMESILEVLVNYNLTS